MVESEGYLCTSPLADSKLTSRYATPPYSGVGWEDFNAHVRLLDAATPHFHVWMVNVYRGSAFGDLFSEYAKVSGKPLLLGEFGVDAYDAYAQTEDQAAHARYTVNLVETLERS